MSFDQLASHYRWMESVIAGGVLQRARIAHLSQLDEAQNILLVGEGPGKFLQALRTRRPDVPVTVVDGSEAMLVQARRSASTGPTEFISADLTDWEPPVARWDAVVTHCFLDCFPPAPLETVINTLARAVTPAADWLITDFTLPARGWRRRRAHLAHTLMYRTFRLATGLTANRWTDPAPWLHDAGFELRARQPFNHGLIHADHWQRE